MNDRIYTVDHPLIQHKLTLMRRKDQSTAVFRQLLREISTLLAYEVTRDLPLTLVKIDTPMEEMQAPVLSGKKLRNLLGLKSTLISIKIVSNIKMVLESYLTFKYNMKVNLFYLE